MTESKNVIKVIDYKYMLGILIMIMGIITFLFWVSKKEVWFCDEIYTFQSAHGMEQE